jgi:alanine racemase
MLEPFGHRPTWAEIDLDNLAFNFHSVKQFVGENIEYMAVVKANAYGHDAVECSRRLEAEGVDWFAVATVEEGVELREAGIGKPVLILGGFWPGQESLVLDRDLTPVVFRIDQAKTIGETASRRNAKVKIHVKFDTGMGRIGFPPQQAHEVADEISELDGIEVEGLMTHFAAADMLSESDFTNHQIARFSEVVTAFHSHGFRPKYLDMANSPGAVLHPLSRSRLARIGGLLYGLGDVLPQEADGPELRPVMSLRSKIALVKKVPSGETIGYGRTFSTVRDSLIATIPLGYHDGLSRSLSNKGRVLVKGEFAPIVGRISMDWTIADVTDIPGAKPGDVVTIIGSDGNHNIAADDIARLLGTIAYEVTCGIDKRVIRVFS